MIDKSHDIFDQIDALLERRGSEVLSERRVPNDDFPMLTDVIDNEPGSGAHGGERRKGSPSGNDRRAKDRRATQRRHGDGSESSVIPESAVEESLNSDWEQRLAEFFIVQQMRLEEMVRRVVREELNNKDSDRT